MIRVSIRDHISSFFQHINQRGAGLVTLDDVPPIDTTNPALPFAGFFTDITGSKNINVDGSVTSQDFSIGTNGADIYINSIIFKLVDASMTFAKFGGITELTNGCQLIYKTGAGEQIIYDGIVNNFNLTQLTGDNQADIITNFKGSDNGFAPVLNPKIAYGFRYGFKLRAKTLDTLTFRVNDNLTAISEFDIYATGKEIQS